MKKSQKTPSAAESVTQEVPRGDSAGSSIGGLRRYARWLDSSIRLPGGATIGVGSLIGVVPGIGDTLGALLDAYLTNRSRVARKSRINVGAALLAVLLMLALILYTGVKMIGWLIATLA